MNGMGWRIIILGFALGVAVLIWGVVAGGAKLEERQAPTPPRREELAQSCECCKHYLGGGACALGLESECAAGGFEAKEEY